MLHARNTIAVILAALVIAFLVFAAIKLTIPAFLAVFFGLVTTVFLLTNSFDFEHPGVIICSALALGAGILAALANYPSIEEQEKIDRVFELALAADRDLVKYQIGPDVRPLVQEAVFACASEDHANILQLTGDLALAQYEPEVTSWYSWALRSKPKRVDCLTAAKRVENLSPQFAIEFRAITTDQE